MRGLKRILRRIWYHHCPECDGEMTSCFEMELDRLLYTCKECGKEWI
jgi:predicted RNA-binding Zn-ribbon protein involved in translation (DUF1610 family)